ncbi:hypothetical protein FB446DRAFT_730748 [Lentinula raphanica]|nr:hypothetical protein FB446DRAFT_730748 [Lentinula raphanica]
MKDFKPSFWLKHNPHRPRTSYYFAGKVVPKSSIQLKDTSSSSYTCFIHPAYHAPSRGQFLHPFRSLCRRRCPPHGACQFDSCQSSPFVCQFGPSFRRTISFVPQPSSTRQSSCFGARQSICAAHCSCGGACRSTCQDQNKILLCLLLLSFPLWFEQDIGRKVTVPSPKDFLSSVEFQDFRAEYFVISGQGQLVPQPSFDISLVRPSSKWFELYFVEPAPLREASSSRGHPVGDSGHAYVKSLLLLSVQQAGVILNEGDIFWFPHNENYDTITAAVAKEKGFTAKCKLSHTYEDPVHGFIGVDSITLIVEPCPGGCKSPTGYVKELQRDEPRPLDLLKTPSGKDVMRECRAFAFCLDFNSHEIAPQMLALARGRLGSNEIR